jgi:proline iminopeptidase
MSEMDPDILEEIQRYEANLRLRGPALHGAFDGAPLYVHHVLRMPAADWSDPVNRGFDHINPAIYVPMQGPSELGASGKLADWDRTADLSQIEVPTLIIGARHDTMDPNTMDPIHMEWMGGAVWRGRYLYCPEGSHLALYEDQATYFGGLIEFIHDVSAGRF